MDIKKYFNNQARTIFIQPPSLEITKERLINRETESQNELSYRIEKMENELQFAVKMDYKLSNDDLSTAKSTIYEYVKKFLIL